MLFLADESTEDGVAQLKFVRLKVCLDDIVLNPADINIWKSLKEEEIDLLIS
jgi:hypothetical protein